MVPKVLKKVVNFEKMSYIKNDEEMFSNHKGMIDCALGTNPFGYSETIKSKKDLEHYGMNDYPDYPYDQLKKAVAKHWSDTIIFDSKRIEIGSGTLSLLININKMFVDVDTTVLGYCPQFTEYISDVRSLGGRYEFILLRSENDLELDIRELIRALDEKQSLVYVDNPNNPTGQIIPLDDLRLLAVEAERMGICLVVDEAYGDFMEKSNSALNLVDEFDNIFVVRSLSKGFGLAGIRVGYMVCSKALQTYYKKVAPPFCVTSHSESVARSALRDYGFVLRSIEKIVRRKKKILAATTKLEIMKTDLSVPIMVLRHPDVTVDLHLELLRHNVLTESGADFIGMGKNAVRMRVPKEVDQLIEALKKVV